MRNDRNTRAPGSPTGEDPGRGPSAEERDVRDPAATAAAERAGDAEGGRALSATLDGMASYAPSPDFGVRVVAAINTPESWWTRLWRRVAGAPAPEANVFAAFLDEGLTARQARALTALVAEDSEAAAALDDWKRLFAELESLPALAPAEGFADRVVARARLLERRRAARPKPVPAGSPRPAGIGGLRAAARGWELATAWVGARWPTPGDRFAVTSGMAVGPVAAFLVILHTLSGNPLLTTSNLTSFLRTRIGGAVSEMSHAVSSNPAAEAALGRVSGLVGTWDPGNPVFAAGLIGFGALTLLSAWILYANVFKVPRMEGRHAQV